MTPTTRALVFDFDGTIIDSETPVYESWAETFRFAGAEPIPLERWLQDIGKADGHGIDVRSELCNQIGVDAISAQVETFRKDLCGEMSTRCRCAMVWSIGFLPHQRQGFQWVSRRVHLRVGSAAISNGSAWLIVSPR